MFVSAEQINTHYNGTNPSFNASSSGTTLDRFGWSDRKDETTRYVGKFDWNLTDNHRLELTLLGDDPRRDEKLTGFGPSTPAGTAAVDWYPNRSVNNGVVGSSAHYRNIPSVTPGIGAETQILKYTGNLTDDLTLTSLYGESKTKHSNTYDGYDINSPLFQVFATSAANTPFGVPNNPQPLTGNILPPGAEDKIKSFRLDIEYKLGSHKIRAGLDNNKLISNNAGEFLAGGGRWDYFKTATPNSPITLTGKQVVVASGGGLGTQGYYVKKRFFNDATSVFSDQDAQYVEDQWQVTKDVVLTAGLRNEGFKNKNGDGQTFLEQKNQKSPRFAAAWDVNGDGSFKLYGTTGRYAIQIPTHIGVRGASRSTLTDQYFTYTGIDANGVPTGQTAITGVLSSNNEFGQAKDPLTISATNLKPSFQDEITLGLEKNLTNDYTFGARVTYRKLKSTIDDFCDGRPLDKWLARHPEVNASKYDGFGCVNFNPGREADILVDFQNTDPALAGKVHTPVHLTVDDLGFPDAKRSYFALDLSLEHAFRNSWYAKMTYTWSRSRGNTEGQTLSDVGQTDVAATRTWDYPELSKGADGLLPNDRTHQLKAFGYYEVTPQWVVGGNLLMSSGRPQNCLGNDPNPAGTPNYLSATFNCGGHATPRGSQGKLPWDIQIDMNIVYKPQALKDVLFKLDIFNLFNKQTAQNIDETYNSNTAGSVAPTFDRVLSYTNPRTVRLTAQYNHKF